LESNDIHASHARTGSLVEGGAKRKRKERGKKGEEEKKSEGEGLSHHFPLGYFTLSQFSTLPAAVRVSQPEPVHRLKYHQNR